MNDLFPDLQQQLDKLTVVRYDLFIPYSQQNDSLQENDARCDETMQRSRYTNKGGKVSSLL